MVRVTGRLGGRASPPCRVHTAAPHGRTFTRPYRQVPNSERFLHGHPFLVLCAKPLSHV